MKTCPVCRTMLFDDMDTCYGCMYRFGSNVALEEKVKREIDAAGKGAAEEGASSAAEEATEIASAKAGDATLVEAVGVEENARDMRTWIVMLEVRNGNDPDQTWSVELVPPYGPAPGKGGFGAQAIVPPPQESLALSAN